MKIRSAYLPILLAVILLLPNEIFACACCADEGFYRLSVHKPTQFELGEMKRLSFQEPQIYATAGFPDNIKGLDPADAYTVKGTIGGNKWGFTFTDDKGKTGTLNLKVPKKIVDYAVDIHEKKEGSPGMVSLYKEWRFKTKVLNGTGIFADGLRNKAEYFLVLQGRGNLCASAEQFTNWRLEVTGKKASYAFFGKLSATADTAMQKRGDGIGNNTPRTINVRNGSTPSRDDFRVENLIGTNYSGCGCSGATKNDVKNRTGKIFFWSEFKPNSKDETVIFNVNGKDTEFKLIKKGARPEKEKVGDKFSDEYIAGNTKVIIDYVTKKLPCEQCEGTDYDVTATIIGEFDGKVVSLDGSCGC